MPLKSSVQTIVELSGVSYSLDYLANLKNRFPDFAQKTDAELISALTEASDRKELEYEADYIFAELKRILYQRTAQTTCEDIDKRFASLTSIRNEKNLLLLFRMKSFFDGEGKDICTDPIVYEKIVRVLQYLENKNKLSNKNTKYFHNDDARPHPRGMFNLYPDIAIEGAFEKIPYNIEYSLMIRPPYNDGSIYQNKFLLGIEYREGAKRNRRNDINGYLTRDLAHSANELALNFCIKEGYAIVDYYSSYPNFFCLVKKI